MSKLATSEFTMSDIPGPRGLPFIGVVHKLLLQPLAYQEELVAKYGRINRIPLGRKSIILLHDAYAIDEVLRKHGKKFLKAPMGMEAVEPLLGESVASLIDMERWQFAHNLIMPLFTPDALSRYWYAVVAAVESEVERLARYEQAGNPFDLYTFLHEAMFRILMQTIFSGDFSDEEVAEMVELFNDQTVYIGARYLSNSSKLANLIPAVRRGRQALESLNHKVGAMICRRQENPPTEVNDMLDAMLLARHEDGSPLTFKELRDNCMTMLFGGHETTAGSVTWAFGLLDMNRQARDKFHAEIDQVLAHGPSNYMQMRDFTYTNMVLDEAMRLYPMFPYLFRQAAEDTQVAGYEIRAGDTLAFSAWTTHRDPRFWPEPEKFIPERHTQEQKKARLNAAFLPFSQGLRRCIGERVARMEASLLLAMVSRRFELHLVDQELPQPKVAMSIKPKGGMPVLAVAR